MADDRVLPAGIVDARALAMLDLLDRVAEIERAVLLLYRPDDVQASALFALAWQFGVTGLAGWDLADSEAKRRELVRRALELHRYKGTPWVIKETLAAAGFPDVEINEGFGRSLHDGATIRDGTTNYAAGLNWGFFRVICGEEVDDRPITPAVRAIVTGVINTWKNARSELTQLRFRGYRHDGRYHYDGTMNHCGI